MKESLVLVTTTLDAEVFNNSELLSNIAYLVLDVQGAELEVLRGSLNVLPQFDLIMCEVSTRELYKGAPVYLTLAGWLIEHGFTLIADDLNHQVGWGDALFMRTSLLESHYPHIQPLGRSMDRVIPSSTVFLRGILMKIGVKPEYLTKKFLKGMLKR